MIRHLFNVGGLSVLVVVVLAAMTAPVWHVRALPIEPVSVETLRASFMREASEMFVASPGIDATSLMSELRASAEMAYPDGKYVCHRGQTFTRNIDGYEIHSRVVMGGLYYTVYRKK